MHWSNDRRQKMANKEPQTTTALSSNGTPFTSPHPKHLCLSSSESVSSEQFSPDSASSTVIPGFGRTLLCPCANRRKSVDLDPDELELLTDVLPPGKKENGSSALAHPNPSLKEPKDPPPPPTLPNCERTWTCPIIARAPGPEAAPAAVAPPALAATVVATVVATTPATTAPTAVETREAKTTASSR